MLKVQKQAKAIKKIQEVTLLNLRQQLAETTGIFKGKEHKALEKQIQQTEAEAEKEIPRQGQIIITTAGRPAMRSYIYHSVRKHPARFLVLQGLNFAIHNVRG